MNVGHSCIANVLRGVGGVRVEKGGDLAPGWQERVVADICEKHKLPGCLEGAAPLRRVRVTDMMRFLKAVKAWYSKGGEPVPRELAEERAAVCAKCPFNVDIKGCGACLSVARTFFPEIAKLSTAADKQLKACNVCGCQNRISVWVPWNIKTAGTKNLDTYHELCWISTERQSS